MDRLSKKAYVMTLAGWSDLVFKILSISEPSMEHGRYMRRDCHSHAMPALSIGRTGGNPGICASESQVTGHQSHPLYYLQPAKDSLCPA